MTLPVWLSRALLTSSVLLIFFNAVYANTESIQVLSEKFVIIDSVSVALEGDLITKDDVLFVALQDCLTKLGGSVEYLRKDEAWILRLPKQKLVCRILPYSEECWINDTRHLLSTAPIYFDNRLYIPAKEFLGLIKHALGTEMLAKFKPNRPEAGVAVKKIQEMAVGDQIRVQVESSKPFAYSAFQYKDPDRLIVDIPDAVSELPLITRSDLGGYTRIRASQFENQPPKVRIVFDLRSTAKLVSKEVRGNTLTLMFSVPREEQVIKMPDDPLLNRVIVLDPGHGGRDPGAMGLCSNAEKSYTLDISIRVKNLLAEKGAFVIMCRQGDDNPTLQERTDVANKNKADAFVSIHINSFFKPHANGTETYFYKPKDHKLAHFLHQAITKQLNLKDNGLKKGRLYVLNHSDMAAALVEPLFITHPKESDLLDNSDARQKIAMAIFEGIRNYFIDLR